MATRFAVKTGNWSDVTTWDNGALPSAVDTIHPNGFIVTIDTDISVSSLNNNTNPVYLPNIATPAMTSNTQPTGTVISSNNSATAYVAFNQDNVGNLYWGSGVANTGWLGYTFSTGKVIKRYYIKQQSLGQQYVPKTWTFEGSNDGFATAGVQLDYVASYTTNANYTSVLLANTTAYTSYRINITAVFSAGAGPLIAEFEMTENTNISPTYGNVAGGSFIVPASLSGIRNITQSGDGIKTNSTTIISILATAGAIVNFNINSGGYIFNQLGQRGSNMTTPIISITGNCAINFNADLWGWQNVSPYYITNGNIGILAAATVTVNGNIYGSKGGLNAANFDSVISVTNASAILNVNGNIYGGSNTAFGHAIISRAINTINVTGNVFGDLSAAIYSDSAPIINLIGTATVNNINSSSAIYVLSTTALLTITGSITNKFNTNSILAAKIRFASTATPYWIYQTNGTSDMTLSYGTPVTGAYPTEADVKLGVTYAASPTRTGTCAVPLPQYVSQGVATGATVGTAYINAADVWNVLSSSITTAGSIGERLKIASTVETTGDQLAAYIV